MAKRRKGNKAGHNKERRKRRAIRREEAYKRVEEVLEVLHKVNKRIESRHQTTSRELRELCEDLDNKINGNTLRDANYGRNTIPNCS